MDEPKLGVLLWNQGTDWATYEAAARRVDELGYDHLWAWDHLYAIYGDPYQSFFEGWTTLAAWAKVTGNVRIGLLVGANTLRNPGLVARQAVTLDHITGGRAILGLGGGWFELEHRAHGIEFGSGHGERLAWLDEAVGAARILLAGEKVTSPKDGHYAFDELRLLPRPVTTRLPIMIGGSGERRTLRTVARYADMWNATGTIEFLRHKEEVLRRHCQEVGRDEREIERTVVLTPIIRDTEFEARRAWQAMMAANRTPMSEVSTEDESFQIGTPEKIAERMRACIDIGFSTFIAELPSPYDQETLERWIGEVKPLVAK